MKCVQRSCTREVVDERYKLCITCREYARKVMQKYRKLHPTKSQAYRSSHREQISAYRRQYTQMNREELHRKRRQYYLDNYELELARHRQWKKDTPEKHRINGHNRRARKRTNGGTFNFKELNELFEKQEGFCVYCGELLYSSFDKDIHIDHKTPISRGGSNDISNIALSCATCNLQKGAKTAEEFIQTRQLFISTKESLL